jgi:hypothetical protein
MNMNTCTGTKDEPLDSEDLAVIRHRVGRPSITFHLFDFNKNPTNKTIKRHNT